ncbi:hypothetical protein [Halobacterium zhouii]|uniref:hypothetical protein n=1 Tax=Halobacterium zhouii TaxID=2902624 RepID=UPI001E460089|nr:hypothetical protein [Halobacterium zhouii]
MSDVVLVDATTLIALGTVGEIQLLANFDGDIVVPAAVIDEVTTEPANTNASAFLGDSNCLATDDVPRTKLLHAQDVLGDDRVNGDVQVIAGVLHRQTADQSTAVVSDDRRVRTVARGLGATVTGTVGVVVRAVHEGMDADDAKDLIREIDSHGLHMTGELREKAYELIDGAGGN